MIRFMRGAIAAIAAVALAASAMLPAAMAAGFNGDIAMSLTGKYIGTNALGQPHMTFNYQKDLPFTEGVAANQADKVFADTRTLAASTSENLDLAAVLADPLGVTLTCVTIKAIIFKAAAANTNDVVVGAAGSNPFLGPLGGTTPTVAVRPGGILMMVAPATGWAVNASTAHLLKVLNGGSGTGVTYDVIFVCTSA